MLEVALRAAAPVASDDVLAAVLAAVVALAFVHICKRSRASSEPHQQLPLRSSAASPTCLRSQKARLERIFLLKSYSSKALRISTLIFRDSGKVYR